MVVRFLAGMSPEELEKLSQEDRVTRLKQEGALIGACTKAVRLSSTILIEEVSPFFMRDDRDIPPALAELEAAVTARQHAEIQFLSPEGKALSYAEGMITACGVVVKACTKIMNVEAKALMIEMLSKLIEKGKDS